jgi:hypothetical protein
MNPDILPGETSKRALTADDKNGVCTIYPTGAATATCGGVTPTPAKSGGCSTGGVGGEAMGLLGLLLLRRRNKPSRGTT